MRENDVRVAQEMVSVARELSALGVGLDTTVDPDRIDELAAKFLARLGNVKMRQLRTYGLELRPTDTVDQLAHAWATVLLAQ